MNTEQHEFLSKVIKSFDGFAKRTIKEKEKDPNEPRDQDNNVNLHLFDLEFFCDNRKNFSDKMIPHKDLESLAVSLSENYPLLNVNDLYWVMPQIILNIYQAILWKKPSIRMSYHASQIGKHRMRYAETSFGLTPKATFPIDFEDLYKKDFQDFLNEVIEATLNDLTKKYDQTHFEFELKLNCEIISDKDDEINIDDRLNITLKNQEIIIKGQYKGNPWDAEYKLQQDLLGILSLFEMAGILNIKDFPKRFGHESHRLNVSDKKIILSHTASHHFSSSIFGRFIHYFEEHLTKFDEEKIGFIPIHHFSLLSECFEYDNLRIIPNFFSSEHFRFSRTEFFNYWSALEILLGNPEEEIRKTLSNAYELFYPEERELKDTKDEPQKTISKLWKIRNDVVHNGKFDVDSSDISTIENVVKNLFNKILLSRMIGKFNFSIKPDIAFTRKKLDL